MDGGAEPDYRFTLANERTFLAWIRTALALLAGALVAHQVIHAQPEWVMLAASGTLAALAAVLSAGAYRHWSDNQQAMRNGAALPRTWLIPLMAIACAMLSVLGAVFIGMHR